jgi:hypothetical protein
MAKKIVNEDVQLPTTGVVAIIGNGVSEYMPDGKEYIVSAIMARTLISKGYATIKK